MKHILILLFILFSVSAHAQGEVGGPCTYEEFDGICTVTSVDPDGTVHFTFEGDVNGERLTLRDNTASSGGGVGTNFDCTLQFIKTGTCTPCVISSDSSCGNEAWEAFAAWAATESLSSSGCSLTAF